MRRTIIYITMILLPLTGNAQSGIVPLPLLKLSDNYSFDNPASAVLRENADLKIIHSSYTGLGGNVGLNYIDGSFTIKNKRKTNAHIPGILIHSEYETDILKRTRLLFRYSWNTKLTEHTKLSAGIHAGFFNYSIRSSNSNSGISVFAPDANIGLWLLGKKMNLGIASAQLLNSKIKPVNTQYSLNRYFIFNADYNLFSSAYSQLKAGTKIYYNGKEYKGFTAALILQLKENFSTEINYTLKKGIAFSAGIIRIPLLGLKGDLYFSYFNSTGVNNLLNSNRIEVNLRLYLLKSSARENQND